MLDGDFKTEFLTMVWPDGANGTQFWAQHPSGDPPNGKGWPVVVFMHALNLGYEWYQPQVERWASYGFVAIFPFIQSAQADDTVTPIVQETDGATLRKALAFAHEISAGSIYPALKGKLDLTNMAFAGHNMGAVEALRVTAAAPPGTVKLVIALHPFVCDIGPPPGKYTISSKEIKEANDKADLMYFTSEKDNAFGPGTANRQHSCFVKNVNGNAIFANFKGAACDAFPNCTELPATGPYGKLGCKPKFHVFGKQHFCPCSAPGVSRWVSPEAQWLTTAFRTYLQFDMQSDSACYQMLWGKLSEDPNVASSEVQREQELVVV
jgi:dienelactone hydrolase